MNVKNVSVEELYFLRHNVLRQGKSIESTYYDRDKNDDTIQYRKGNGSTAYIRNARLYALEVRP